MQDNNNKDKISNTLEQLKSAQQDIILLLGQTGGGKSSIANKLIGGTQCKEGSGLRSVTDDLHVVSNSWFGKGATKVTVVDTPGFLDTERRDAEFMKSLAKLLDNFPKDKLRVVVVTLPLMETRAKSTYKDMLDEIELLLGGEVWKHTMFVTTLQNQLKDTELARTKIEDWKGWLVNTCNLEKEQINHCNFIYNDPESLNPVKKLFDSISPFTPKSKKELDVYLSSNPSATVEEIIKNVESFRKLQADWEKKIQSLIEEKEASIAKFERQSELSERLAQSLQETKAEVENLKRELAVRPKEVIREVHHHHEKGGSKCLVM